MRRFTMGGFGAVLVAVAFVVPGCGGGGVEEGLPQDTATPPIPPNVQMKMVPFKNQQARGKTSGARGHASVSRGQVSRYA
jgi:hypothetical protein